MSYFAKRTKRIVAGTLVGALALSVSPILGLTGTAGALEPADPLGTGNFCEDVPQSEPFTDVQPTDPAYGNIVCLVATEITTGVTATTYEPNSPVTRRQMALFLVRLANEADRLEVGDNIEELPAPTAPAFTDVAGESQAVKDAISQLDQADVANGTTATTYSPGANVSRRQMAAFIDRLYEFLTGTELPVSGDQFSDDNADSAEAQESTNAVAEAGIFIGNANGTFGPAQAISRRQMASVITRTLQVLFENGEITQWADEPEGNQAFTVDKTATQVLPDSENDPQVTEITFGGLTAGTDYDIVLVPCNVDDEGSQVFSDGMPFIDDQGVSHTGGTISFNDDYGGAGGQPDDQADNWGFTNGSGIEITLVGSTPTGGTAYADGYEAPASGSLRVTIEGDGDDDCGIPVILADPTELDTFPLGDSNEETAENDDTPARPFAVGPAVVSFSGVGANADTPSSQAEYVGAASQFPTLLGNGDDKGIVLEGDGLFGVDFDADNFFYEGSEFEGPITREQARAYLTIGDYIATCDDDEACNNITTPYTATGANNWLFDFDDELPAPPTNVVATVGNLDGDGETGADDVNLSWAAPSFGTGMGGDVDEYCMEIWNANNLDGGTADYGCTDEVDSAQTGDAPTSIVCTATDCEFEDLAPGTYVARADYADSETDDESGSSAWSAPFTVVGPPGPQSTSATANDVGGSGTVTAGDILTVVFNAEMDGTAGDDAITLSDADGTTCTFADAGASTFLYSDTVPAVTGNDTLTITVGAPDNCVAAGTVGGLQYPATVVAGTNIKAQVGSSWDVANSPDKTFT